MTCYRQEDTLHQNQLLIMSKGIFRPVTRMENSPRADDQTIRLALYHRCTRTQSPRTTQGHGDNQETASSPSVSITNTIDEEP